MNSYKVRYGLEGELDVCAANKEAAELLARNIVIEKTGKEYIDNSFTTLWIDEADKAIEDRQLQSKQREMLVFGQLVDWSKAIGGTISFENLCSNQLEQLVARGLVDLNEKQNEAPSVGEIREFLKTHPECTAHGYLVTPNRTDCRLSIEGVEGSHVDIKTRKDFMATFGNADEIEISNLRIWCWYD